MKHSPLSRVESLLRRVVEEPFTWLGSGSLDPFQLATHLVKSYESSTTDEEQPNRFTIYINAEDLRGMEGELPALEHQVANYVMLMAERRGYHLAEPPIVSFAADPLEATRRAHIVATYEVENQQGNTQVFSADIPDSTQEAIQAADAFLIVGGRQHIPLDRPITRIGRRTENDIVLDSPSISRQHAQIRWRRNYFVLYDVSSHGRTLVNGMATQEHILRPGDVIAFSDILLVYGEGREDMLSSAAVPEHEELDTTMLKPEE